MPDTNDVFMRFMAAWALVHETADEGMKASVERGKSMEPGEMSGGPEAFVDGFAAMIAEEKERLKAELAAGEVRRPDSAAQVSENVDELRFEIGELRGRIESLQSSLDALIDRESKG